MTVISDRSSTGSAWISRPVYPFLTITRSDVTLYRAHRRSIAAQANNAMAPPNQMAHPLIPCRNINSPRPPAIRLNA